MSVMHPLDHGSYRRTPPQRPVTQIAVDGMKTNWRRACGRERDACERGAGDEVSEQKRRGVEAGAEAGGGCGAHHHKGRVARRVVYRPHGIDEKRQVADAVAEDVQRDAQQRKLVATRTHCSEPLHI